MNIANSTAYQVLNDIAQLSKDPPKNEAAQEALGIELKSQPTSAELLAQLPASDIGSPKAGDAGPTDEVVVAKSSLAELAKSFEQMLDHINTSGANLTTAGPAQIVTQS